jgi:UPF0755 protein
MKRALLILTAAILLALATLLFLRHESYRRFQNETFLRLEKGTGTVEIGRALAQTGVIRFPWLFWLERALNPSAKLQAGEYRFRDPATVAVVFDRIARGDVYYVEYTVKEGSNMFDIASGLESAGAMPADDFLRAAADPAPILDLAPSATTLEGYLYPATYRVSHSTTPRELALEMTNQFRRQWKKLSSGAPKVNETVTLASLVEKETSVPEERPLVAGVFENRLEIGMPLQCDPTTIYAALLENRYRNAIHQSDLKSQNPYNTYQHTGLPPGPIANPGAASIQAALHPAETDYLYFVAKPNGGGHQFSATLTDHAKAAREYRKKSQKKP